MLLTDFEDVTNALANGSPASEKIVRDRLISLQSRYQEPWRHYHNVEHPRELFEVLISHIDVIRNPRTVGWAIMYHDAIYDPESERGRNEELSAQLAENELVAVEGKSMASLVARYTRATAKHQTDGSDEDLDFFLDADLVILGSSPERYNRYAKDIRLEYEHVPPEQYKIGRLAILESLATRAEQTGLFRTELFKAGYEDQAQENITLEADLLRRVG